MTGSEPHRMGREKSVGGAEEGDRLLTVREAAAYLRLSPLSLYHFISQRRIPVVRLSSRCVRFSRHALSEWVESLTQKAGHEED
jgi:excisionase family DNA binding protein